MWLAAAMKATKKMAAVATLVPAAAAPVVVAAPAPAATSPFLFDLMISC